MTSDDELLRDALREDAGEATAPLDGFDRVREVARERAGRRRRIVLGSIAAAVVVAAGVGTAYAVSRNDGDSVVLTAPSTSSTIAPTTSSTASTTTTQAPTTTAATTTTTTAPPQFTTGTLPAPDDFAGVSGFRTVPLDGLDPIYTAPAADPQAKVGQLAGALRSEPIEGRRDAFGVVTAVQGNRAQVEVRVVGLADDSIGGRDWRLHLLQEQPGGPWTVVAVEQRDLCSRGFDGSVCV
jgi:hypothetical protein